MKKLFFYMLAGSLVFSACKKEGCTDETATNYNADAKTDDGSCVYPAPVPDPDTQKPVATAGTPTATKLAPGESMEVTVSFTDNEGLAAYAAAATGGTVDNSAGTLSGKSQDVKFTVSTTASTAPGNYTLTITCADAAGNAGDPITLAYEVTTPPDTEKPAFVAAKVNSPRSDGKLESGSTPNKVEFHFTDNVELGEIKITLHDVNGSNDLWTTTIPATENAGKKEYKKVLDVRISTVSGVNAPCKWKVVAKDAAGNELTDEKDVTAFQ